ncbi:7 transmembrane receptor [Opisthorchis viverrini]|uniref:7 transmembrane receptor n=1 Tax=Opisthorchis viverrini TaxID=6198 RepID=A0A1S8XAW3_OPIVI|nr:7 transmembrane receptor [Opisthorchis viverrini]
MIYLSSNATLSIRILLAIFGAVGTILNCVVLYSLCFVRINSKLTTFMLRCQCVADCYSCLTILLYQIVGVQIKTGSNVFDEILCYIWADYNIFWIGYVLSVQNSVCISFDRLIAVIYPVRYMLHKRALKIGVCLYLSISGLFLIIPNFFLRKFSDGECQFGLPKESGSLLDFNRASSFIWFIGGYVLPIFFILVSNALVIYVMCKKIYPVPNDAQVGDAKHMRHSLRKLTCTTVVMAITLLCSHAVDEIVYLLASLDVLDYTPGTLLHETGLLLIMTGTCTLPIILTVNIQGVRDHLWKSAKLLAQQCSGKRKADVEPSSRGTEVLTTVIVVPITPLPRESGTNTKSPVPSYELPQASLY